MKRFLSFLIAVLITGAVCYTGLAEKKVISYEQLRTIAEPCTVYVEAKTADPYPVHGKDVLTSKTRWNWLVKNEAGTYVPSVLYLTIDEYKARSLSERDTILKHEICRLELQIDSKLKYRITEIKEISEPFQTNDVIGFLIAILILALGALYTKWLINNSDKPAQNVGRRPSKLLVGLYILNGLFGNDRKK